MAKENKSVREEMLETIRSGHSAVYKGVHYVTASEVPTDAELASGDTERASVADQLKDQIELLQEQLKKVEKIETKSENKSDNKSEDEDEDEDKSDAKSKGKSDEKSKVGSKPEAGHVSKK